MRAGCSEENKQGVFVQVTLLILACQGGTKCTAVKEVSLHAYGRRSNTTGLAQASQKLPLSVMVWSFRGSCCSQHWNSEAFQTADCAERDGVLPKCQQAGHSALAPSSPPAGTNNGDSPTAPAMLNGALQELH